MNPISTTKSILLLCLILLVILAVLLLSVWFITHSANRVTADYPRLKACIDNDDWAEADRIYTESIAMWNKVKRIWSTLIDQDNMRDIEIAFVDLQTAIDRQNTEEAQKELAQLEFYLKHIAESETLHIENIF